MNDDIQLIKNIKNNVKVDESLSTLYDLYSGVYFKIIHNHFQKGRHEEKKQELINECSYHIYFAAIEFKFDKNIKFSSYLGCKARWLCLNFFNREKMVERNLNLSNSNPQKSFDSLIPEIIKTETLKKIRDELREEEDLRVAKIFSMRYFDSENNKISSWKKISTELNMSIQGCINIHNRFIKKIKNKNII
tara:strand:- start:869 stop:1441 length:573 start_codon:yes stop_codon:yes gene_type:complete